MLDMLDETHVMERIHIAVAQLLPGVTCHPGVSVDRDAREMVMRLRADLWAQHPKHVSVAVTVPDGWFQAFKRAMGWRHRTRRLWMELPVEDTWVIYPDWQPPDCGSPRLRVATLRGLDLDGRPDA